MYRIYERELPDVAYNQVEIEDSGDELVAVEQIEQHEQATVIPPAVVAGGDEWPEPQELRPDFLDVPPFPHGRLTVGMPNCGRCLRYPRLPFPGAGRSTGDDGPGDDVYFPGWQGHGGDFSKSVLPRHDLDLLRMQSGERKTPVMKLLLSPYLDWEQKQREKRQQEVSARSGRPANEDSDHQESCEKNCKFCSSGSWMTPPDMPMPPWNERRSWKR